jgi:hypothetical protein
MTYSEILTPTLIFSSEEFPSISPWQRGTPKRMSQDAEQTKLTTTKIIIAMVAICILISAVIVELSYSNYTEIINDKDKTIQSLNYKVHQLELMNKVVLFEEMNNTLTTQIRALQNQTENYQAQIEFLNAYIAKLETNITINGNESGATIAALARYRQQANDLQTQLNSQKENVYSLIRLNTISSLVNFNDSTVWSQETKGTFTQIAKENVTAATALNLTNLNLIPGKAYFVTVSMVMHPPTNDTYTAYLYVNGDLNKTHYDTSYLYGNARWSWACLQTENDPRIFDNGQYPGSMGLAFSGVLEIDLAGSLRMALTYNAYDNLRADLETGIYGWMYNGNTLDSVNQFFINSTMPFSGIFAIYNMQP